MAGVLVLGGLILTGPRGLGTVLLLAVAAVVALDAVVAVRTTRMPVLTCRVRPCDVVVGDRFAIELDVRGRALPVVLELPGGTAAELLIVPPASGRLDGLAERRGVLTSFPLSVRSSGLCGLVSCSRRHYVALARPLETGPRPVPAAAFPDLPGDWGDGAATAVHDGELVRGLRDYLPGDRLRQVHWRATAHTGELVVKETEEPQAPVLHLVLDLGGGGVAGEAAAGRAAWYAGEALRRGYHVTLTTMEDGHPLTDAAPSLLQVNRRLARTGAGSPPLPTDAHRGERVLVVTDVGDTWP
jgi:uncharacterized protein (DUF58 family)